MKASLALAAFVALSGAAEAKTKTEVVSLDGHCDVLTLRINKSVVAGTDDPNCATGFGGGFIGKVKGFGNAVVAGVQFSGEPGAQVVIRVAYPLVTGGNWNLYATTDGVTMTKLESGTYTVEGTAAKGARGTASIARDALKEAGR